MKKLPLTLGIVQAWLDELSISSKLLSASVQAGHFTNPHLHKALHKALHITRNYKIIAVRHFLPRDTDTNGSTKEGLL